MPTPSSSSSLRFLVLFGLAALSLLGPFSARAGAGAAPEPGNTLGDDDRLLKKITLRRPDTTLRSLLEEIGKTTGTKLTPPKDLAEQKFTLYFKERPAARVMAVLAEYLDRKWARKGDGYELFADRAAQQRESEHANAPLAAIFKELDGRIALSRLPRDEVDRLWQEYQNPDRSRKPTREDMAERIARGNRLGSVRGQQYDRPMTMALRSLTSDQVKRLKYTGSLRLSSSDGTLPPKVFARMREATFIPERPRPTGERHGTILFSIGIQGYEGYAYTSGTPRTPSLYCGSRIEYVERGKRPRSGGSGGYTRAPLTFIPLPPPDNHPRLKERVRIADLTWTSRFSGLPTTLRAAAAHVERHWRDDPPLSAFLGALHNQTGLDVCADSFVRLRAPIKADPRPANLRTLLDEFTRSIHYAWTLRHDSLQFRSGLYCQDRAREVPPARVAGLRTEIQKAPERQLEALGRALLKLTPDEISGLSDHWAWYFERGPFWVPPLSEAPKPWIEHFGLLALYADLPRQAQESAVRGQPQRLRPSPAALARFRAHRQARSIGWMEVPSEAGLERNSLAVVRRTDQFVLYELLKADGGRQTRAATIRPGQAIPSDEADARVRLLAPPIPMQFVSLKIEAPNSPPPNSLASGQFRILQPIRRQTGADANSLERSAAR